MVGSYALLNAQEGRLPLGSRYSLFASWVNAVAYTAVEAGARQAAIQGRRPVVTRPSPLTREVKNQRAPNMPPTFPPLFRLPSNSGPRAWLCCGEEAASHELKRTLLQLLLQGSPTCRRSAQPSNVFYIQHCRLMNNSLALRSEASRENKHAYLHTQHATSDSCCMPTSRK